MREQRDTEIKRIIDKYEGHQSAMIQILLEIQQHMRWLPKEALVLVSRRLGVPLSVIYHAATFYKAFSLEPRGRHVASVCLGTACHVRGAPILLDRMTQHFGVNVNKTTPNGEFTLTTVNCVGCCALGPVLVVDEDFYCNPSGSELDRIIESYGSTKNEGGRGE